MVQGGDVAEVDMDDMVQATGLVVALIGSLLERTEVIPRGEFCRHLANLAAVTHEANGSQGKILDRWSALAEQVSAVRRN